MSDILGNERVSLATTAVQKINYPQLMRSTRRIKQMNMVLSEQNDTVVYKTSKTDNILESKQLHLTVVPERQTDERKIRTSLRATFGFPCL